MDYSYYNFLILKEDKMVMYNVATDGIVLLNSEIANLVEEHQKDVSKIQLIHPDLYTALVNKGMIVENAADEWNNLINKWKTEDNDSSTFYLTIYPTMNCNLHCWYCYEEHKPHTNMKPILLDRVYKFINSKVRNQQINNLFLSFFGGEPLLEFNNVVLPIMKYSRDVCAENDVNLYIDITTNGVLLSENVRNQILSLDLKNNPVFQITIDGNKEEHNKIRNTTSGFDTYDCIIKNIKGTLSSGMIVNNRFNYTRESVDSFIDVLDVYADITEKEKKLLYFDFQQVWQESSFKNIRDKAIDLALLYSRKSLQVRVEKRYNKERCRDDAENQATINYNGLVYKCTARQFKSDNNEGKLTEDGQIIWNDKYFKRMSIKYGNSFCRSCKIYPICHGGCSQTKLEADTIQGCLFGYSEKEKYDIVDGRLNYILRTKRTSY